MNKIVERSGNDFPTKVGVYVRNNPDCPNKTSYSKWNGEFWCAYWTDKAAAATENAKSIEQNWTWYEEVEFKNQKFRTPTPDISVAVQEKLISMGYKWPGGGTSSSIHYPFIYTDEKGKINGGTTEKFFENDYQYGEYPETIVITEIIVKVKFEEKPKETVEFNGKKYDKKKLEEALKAIENL